MSLRSALDLLERVNTTFPTKYYKKNEELIMEMSNRLESCK